MKQFIAFCGLDCEACDARLALNILHYRYPYKFLLTNHMRLVAIARKCGLVRRSGQSSGTMKKHSEICCEAKDLWRK